MNHEDKQQAVEYLRSVAEEAFRAIDALKRNNFDETRDLMDDINFDMEQLTKLIPEPNA